MKTKLYSIRDRKAGTYGTPFASFNDDTAERDFFGFCGQVQNQYLAGDLELYYLGEFESCTGELIVENIKPVFITQFGVKKDE